MYTEVWKFHTRDAITVIVSRHACTRDRWNRDRRRGREGSRSHKSSYQTRWIWERGVEDRAKRRTCQNSNGPYSTSRRMRRPTRSSTVVRPSPRLLSLSSSHLRQARLYRVEHTTRPRWVPLRSSSTGVPRRPQRSQGEGTSHAPAMSEKSTPLRRGVHTLTRPISIRA